MKAMIVMGMFLSTLSIQAKNDTVFISDVQKAIRFNAIFQTVYTDIAKDGIGLIKGLDVNYKSIISFMKSNIDNGLVCDPNSIIPYLKAKGSMQYLTAYKQMFAIYFREIKSMRTWPRKIYYITDDNGNFVYVELKEIYHDKGMVFDQSMLKQVIVNKRDLRELGLKI